MSFRFHPIRSAGRGTLAALVGLALVMPHAAMANGDSIWIECAQTNGVTTNHSQADFEDALKNPPADASEYSDCLDQIRNAQIKAARGGTSSGGGTGGSGTIVGGGTGGGGSTGGGQTVAPKALQQALAASGVNPAAPVGTDAPPPAPTVVDGKTVDLGSNRVPSIASAFSLPLPLAASAVVVLFSAALPLVRYAVGRFGQPAVGTNPAP